MIPLLIYAYGVGSGLTFHGAANRLSDGVLFARVIFAVLWPLALVMDYAG